MTREPFGPRLRSALFLLPVGILVAGIAITAFAQINTTIEDFFQPGSQPGGLSTFITESRTCSFCHAFYDPDQEPYTRWAASVMAQSSRDPVFYACLAIANQDAAFVGDICLRCHAPGAWLEGRSTPTDGSRFIEKDFDGVNCSVCHRLVDPVFDPVNNPPEDEGILAALPGYNTNPHTGQYVIDPHDRRRGPFELDPNFFYHEWRQSPYHREALLCANCHDVSNPAYSRQPDGTYALGPLDEAHPTHDKFDEFPLERTYTEWSVSAFAQGPIEMGGRFGGNITAVSSCQDCHMPKTHGTACQPSLGGAVRDDLPLHNFNGANSWVIRAVRNLYPDNETGLNDDSVAAAAERTTGMLQAASDLELLQFGNRLRVRVINQTGHKLPTGYSEGRRMWVNVRFLDGQGNLVREHGAYDAVAATLDEQSTTVYEGVLGVDQAISDLTGIPVGPSFHFALNNKWYKDNRIPPRGFTNDAFEAAQCAPVDCYYADGEYWDDTEFVMPPTARQAEVSVFYQTTTREYIEFLRDANITNTAGQVAYDQWELLGKSAPVSMDHQLLELKLPGDLDLDGDVDLSDLAALLASYGGGAEGDADGDGDTDLSDLALLLSYFGAVD